MNEVIVLTSDFWETETSDLLLTDSDHGSDTRTRVSEYVADLQTMDDSNVSSTNSSPRCL